MPPTASGETRPPRAGLNKSILGTSKNSFHPLVALTRLSTSGAVQDFLQRQSHCRSEHTSEHDCDSLHQLGTLIEDFTDVDNIQVGKSPFQLPGRVVQARLESPLRSTTSPTSTSDAPGCCLCRHPTRDRSRVNHAVVRPTPTVGTGGCLGLQPLIGQNCGHSEPQIGFPAMETSSS